MTLPFPVQIQHVGWGHHAWATVSLLRPTRGPPEALGYGTPCPHSPRDLENLLDIQLGDQGPHHEADHEEEVEDVPAILRAEEQGTEGALVNPK